ncbi:helix-turn-helix transcriptional regulator [Pseudomonas sp. S36]|uniref:helix-turn-helix transcriptional regulator n=1 Tax=Pseudomonas sp. S36 TaxID=2767447 RepID=UPI00191474EA|nr:WYL domain-containing protein [Pseudomonas sp. S36]MBK4988189.1 WYL domain-containing protein [Pseudomonas sp. S36]
MSDPKDRLFRHLALLRLIPREPKSITTSELFERLKRERFDFDPRTLQRDLAGRLALDFPLLCDESRKPYRWSFPSNTPYFDYPALDTPTALAFVLAQSHLGKLMPPSVMKLLMPHFELAHRQLKALQHNHLAQWTDCVRAMPNGKALQPAEVDPAIWSHVADALLDRRQLHVQYLSRSKGQLKTLRLHPVGIVARHSISYLIAMVDGYSDARQFALHRILQVTCLDAAAQSAHGFDIDDYVQGGGFNSLGPVARVELIADVSPQIAWLLSETPLAPDQCLEPLQGSEWQRLRATVPDDLETLWWLFGLGENVRLQAPHSWAQAIRARLAEAQALYAQPLAEPSSIANHTLGCQENQL